MTIDGAVQVSDGFCDSVDRCDGGCGDGMMLEFPCVGEAYSTGLGDAFDDAVVLEGWR